MKQNEVLKQLAELKQLRKTAIEITLLLNREAYEKSAEIYQKTGMKVFRAAFDRHGNLVVKIEL